MGGLQQVPRHIVPHIFNVYIYIFNAVNEETCGALKLGQELVSVTFSLNLCDICWAGGGVMWGK